MTYPRTTLIWLNFNSIHVIDLIKQSLSSLLALDYADYEVIVVDNGSTDGSYKEIKRYLSSESPPSARVRLLGLGRNFGFTGGINGGYKLRNRDSTYVAIVNNDCVIYPDALEILIDYLENDKQIGAIQGVIARLNKKVIDSAGGFVDELMQVHFPHIGKPLRDVKEPMNVTFCEGTFAIYDVKAIQAFLREDLFVPEGFMYFLEDVLNGLMLWNFGHKCLVVPGIVAEHARQAIISVYKRQVHLEYLAVRNRIALLYLTNSRFRNVVERSLELRMLIRLLFRSELNDATIFIRGVYDGIELGKKLSRKYNFALDVYRRVPIIRVNPFSIIIPKSMRIPVEFLQRILTIDDTR